VIDVERSKDASPMVALVRNPAPLRGTSIVATPV
jgi:hypothetical protein